MADVCELAHNRTITEMASQLRLRDPKRKSRLYSYYKEKAERLSECKNIKDCGDEGQNHSNNPEMTHYPKKAQDIFNRHYDYICEVTGI